MDLDAIAVFVKVIEAGSFSEAARLLKMPKTTVSAKVAALEKRLGVTLIQRTTRKLHITDAGQIYFGHCAVAISEIEKGESALFAAHNKPQGILKVTAPADLGHSLLPKIVCLYRERHPEVQIELIVTNRLIDLIGEGIDVAIRAGKLKDSSLITKKFFEIEHGFWASPAYVKKYGSPQNPNDLKSHKYIAHTAFGSSLALTDGKSTTSTHLKPAVKADDFETIKSMLTLKEGMGILPSFLVSRELKNKELLRILPKWSLKNVGGFSFVYPAQKYSSPKVRAFIDLAMTLIK